jgi:2-keto-3-deoxy-L-rhamnonate aldolase RhmA
MMPEIKNIVRERLEAGELAIGAGVRLGRNGEVVRALKTAGFDFLFIDLEHGSMSLDDAAQISGVAVDLGMAPLVRVPAGEYSMATRALDNGALGIVMPHTDTAEEARRIVEKLKHPPIGHRSVSSSIPQFNFKPVPITEMAAVVNKATLVVVMLETPTAIENAAEIAAVPGVDVLLIGTNDLCAEMGIHGDFGNARVGDAYRRLTEACRKAGKWPGMAGIYDPKLIERYLPLGPRFILAGSDMSFVIGAGSQRANFVRQLGAPQTSGAR